MKSTEEKIAVMQACIDGKQIECELISGCYILVSNPVWNWVNYDYRIKEDKYRPFTPEEAVKHLGKSIVEIDNPSKSFCIEYVWNNGFCIRPHFVQERINIDFNTILENFRFSGDILKKCGVKL